MKKQTNTAPKQNETKVKEDSPKIKTKEDGYIHHLLSVNGKVVDSVLGEDPTPLFHEVDNLYYEHRKKIYNGKLRKGSPFSYQIVKTNSKTPWNETSVEYVAGSLSKHRFRRFEYKETEDDEDGEEYEDFVNGGY